MVLTTANLVQYLLERGLVTFESVVDGDFMVTQASQRNRNFKVLRKRGPGYFVKQIQKWDPKSIAARRREARFYWLSSKDADFTPLAAILPKYYTHDPVSHILVIELLSQGESLAEYNQRVGPYSKDVARALGNILSTYHGQSGLKLRQDESNSPTAQNLPWILSVHETSPDLFDSLSGANSELLKIVQEDLHFSQALEATRGQWQPTGLIHGDIKWDNFIINSRNGSNAQVSLKLVDWELANSGDPCWDAGAVLQAYLSTWIFSMRAGVNTGLEQLVDTAQCRLADIQPAIQTFWNTYVHRLQVTRETAAELLERSLKYGAARMIQTAYEHLYYSSRISVPGTLLLQMSFNILKRPKDAIRYLLGV
jgi:thiamine kinase-like enzyme